MHKLVVLFLALLGVTCAWAVPVRPLPTQPGSVLEAGVVYQVTKDTTIFSGPGQSALVLTNGTTVIDIQKGCWLNLRGGDAVDMTGAGAGIQLPENASLVLLGEGETTVKGGRASNGQSGLDGISDRNGSRGWSHGGAGGAGGGGAGSAIGSSGGFGGAGGVGGSMACTPSASTPGASGGSGGPGEQGKCSSEVGRLYLLGNVSVRLAGGNGGKSDRQGRRGKYVDAITARPIFGHSVVSKVIGKITGGKVKIPIGVSISGFMVGSGGGGGSGSGGLRGSDFGPAGSGGGGGGGGGAAALTSMSFDARPTLSLLKNIIQVIELGGFLGNMIAGKIDKDLHYVSGNDGGSEWFSGWDQTPESSKSIYGTETIRVNGGRGGSMPRERDAGRNRVSGRLYCGSEGVFKASAVHVGTYESGFDSGIRTQVTIVNGEGAVGGLSEFAATLCQRVPNVPVPRRADWIFRGYYAEPGGKGRQYFLATGEPTMRLWDEYVETRTLYAYWSMEEICGLTVDGVNPLTAEAQLKPGVSIDRAKRIITIRQDAGFEGSHVVSGFDVHGYRLRVADAVGVVLSNVVIRLPVQDPLMKNDIRERVPLRINARNTRIGFVGENLLSATEGSWTNGSPDVEVPAVCVEAEVSAEGDFEFYRVGNGPAVLRLSAAGGAPAVLRFADATRMDISIETGGCQFGGGTYVLEPSRKIFDSGRKEQGSCRYVTPKAIDFCGSIVAEVAWRSQAVLDTSSVWYGKLVKPYGAKWKNFALVYGGSVSSGEAKLCVNTAYGRGDWSEKPDLGEVRVDLRQAGVTNDVVSVTFFDESFGSTDRYADYDFADLSVLEGEVRLWLMAGVEQYFEAGGVLFKATPKVGERVIAEPVEMAVKRVSSGKRYPTLSAAIRDLKNGPVASSETLELLRDIHETVSVEQMCDTLTIDGGNCVISNTASATAPMFYQREDAVNQTLVLSNVVLAGFSSMTEPMISTAGRLRLLDCDFANDETVVELVRARIGLPEGVGFEADSLDVHESTALTAFRIDGAGSGVRAVIGSCSIQGDFQEEVMVEGGLLELGGDVDVESFCLGLTGQLTYREEPCSAIWLRLDSIRRRAIVNPVLVANRYGHPTNELPVHVSNIEYGCWKDEDGNIRLFDTRGIVYMATAFAEGTNETEVVVTNSSPIGAFGTYDSIVRSLGPMVTVWTLRKIYQESNEIIEGTTEESVTIPEGQCHELGSCELAFSNAVESASKSTSMRGTEDFECEPVTLDCEVHVEGALKLGNVRFSKPIEIGTNGILIVSDEFDLTNSFLTVRIADPTGIGWMVTVLQDGSTRYSAEDLVSQIRLANGGYRWKIEDDPDIGKRIVVEPTEGVKVALVHESDRRLFSSTADAFAEAASNDVVRLLTNTAGGEGADTVPLAAGTKLRAERTIVVNSAAFDGASVLDPVQPTRLDASSGSLTIEAGSVVRLTNIVVNGTLTLDGAGRIDLLGWAGDPIAVHPLNRGLIASNVPENKLTLADGVPGRLWRSAESNVYYAAGLPLEWDFIQTDNGCGTLYVTNLFGEARSYYLDPTNYVSIASQGLARVRLEDATFGVATNVEVVVVYCDLVAGIFKLPAGYVFEYLAEGEITEEDGVDVAEQLAKTSWKRLVDTDVSAELAAIETLKNVKATPVEGTEELAYDDDGHVITNGLAPKLAFAAPKMLGGTDALGAVFKLVPRNILVDAATGKIGIRFYRDHTSPDHLEYVYFTRLMNDKERLDSIGRWSKRFNSALGVVEALASDGASGGAKKVFDNFMGDVGSQFKKRVTDTSWYKGKGFLAQFSTQAGINAVFTCIGNLVKNAVSPVQFQGKYYTPAMAATAYEACIKKNDADAAVHFQADCEVPSYTVTNGTLRLSGTYEGGFGSVIYGVIANGKQWTSGTTIWEGIGAIKDKAIEALWGVYYMQMEKDFGRLAKTAGNAVGNFVAGLIKWGGDPYCATPVEKDRALVYVANGGKLCLEDFEADWDESGALVDVLGGGDAEVKRVVLEGGYSIEDSLFGVFSVRRGGRLLLEEVEAGADLTVLGAESGVDLTVKDGDFDRSTFDLRGADLKLGSASALESEIRVIGRNKEGESFALGTGASSDEYWANFKSADDDTLVARYSTGKIYWACADPIGTVGGGSLHYDLGFSDLSKMEALIRTAGSSAVVTFLKDVEIPDDWKFPMIDNLKVKGGKRLVGRGGNRSEPLFHVGAGQRLELTDMVFSGFCSTQVPLLDAPGGDVRTVNCDFRENRMTALLDLSDQAGAQSHLAGFYATNDQSSCGIRISAAGHPGHLILDKGVVSNAVGLTVYGEGRVPLSGHFTLGSVTLEGKTALSYAVCDPVPFSLLGSGAHLTGGHCVINNREAGHSVWAAMITVLNEGYRAVNGEDDNVYLEDVHETPGTCDELVYNPTNDVFSVTNGVIPSVGDTNWMARTVRGSYDVFRYGRLTRSALVGVNNGDIVVNCRGTDSVMSGIGATDAEKASATERLLALIGDILSDGSAWFEGAVASNVTEQVIAACLTKTELQVTEKDIHDALMYCTARFAYNGGLYLESESSIVFDDAIESGLPVTVLRDATIEPYMVDANERLTLNATNGWTTSAFSNEIVNVEQAFKWVATMKILPVIEKVAAIRDRGIYSADVNVPAITVLSNAVCSLDGLVMTNDWILETLDIYRGGILELHGDTVIPSVYSHGRSLRAAADFTGSVGVEGRAGCAGVTFAQAADLNGRFYSNSRGFAIQKDGEGRLQWKFTGDLQELLPEFEDDDPLQIYMTTSPRLRAHLVGTLANAESGLWYYFEDSTNLTDFAGIRLSQFSPAHNGSHRVGFTYNVQTNDLGTAVDNARFFRFRITDKPFED